MIILWVFIINSFVYFIVILVQSALSVSTVNIYNLIDAIRTINVIRFISNGHIVSTTAEW